MLGNHDAWTCLTKKRRTGKWGTDDDPAAKVRQQLELNGDRNLAWNCKNLAGKPVSVIGARPFSKVRSHSLYPVLDPSESRGLSEPQ